MVKVEAKAKLKRGVVTDSKSTYGNKAATDSAFKRKHGLKYSSSSSKGSHHVGLRGLDHVTYEEIQKLGQQAARKYLEKTGVILKQNDPKMSFVCWGCHQPMSASGDGSMFRCSRRQCDKKPKLTNPAVAFSPLAGFVSAGWEVDYVLTKCLCSGSEESLRHCSLHLAAQLGGTNRTVGTACKKEKALPNDGGVT